MMEAFNSMAYDMFYTANYMPPPTVKQHPAEKKFDPKRLADLIVAREQIRATLEVLPDDVALKYYKQFEMLERAIDKAKEPR